jgi:hypothetical protein
MGFKVICPEPDPYARGPGLESIDPQAQYPHDGYWSCKCGALPRIVYNSGPHPLGKLTCPGQQCGRKWTPDCHITRVARLFPRQGEDPIPVPRLNSNLAAQIPYVTVCCTCSLTWRARKYSSFHELVKRLKRFSPVESLRKNDGCLSTLSVIGFDHIVCHCGARFDEKSWKKFSIRRDPTYHFMGIDDDFLTV